MSMRIFSAIAIVLALYACSEQKDPGGATSLQEAEAQSSQAAKDNGMIECAVSGMTTFTRTCLVERETADGELILTIRHDDGGFRRFKVLTDGRGVVAADGAEPAVVQTIGTSAIEVQVAGDRYRLPATVKGQKPPVAPAAVAPAAPPSAPAAPKQ